MSESRIDFTLSLIPINKISDSNQTEQEEWLNNDDVSLLNMDVAQDSEKKDASDDDLNLILNQLSSHPEQRIIEKEILEIKSTSQGFELVGEGETVLLKDDDVIRLPAMLLKVRIKQEHVVAYEEKNAGEDVAMPISEVEDIWSTSQDSNYKGNRFVDPFANCSPSNKNSFSSPQDPLDFLYNPNAGSSQAIQNRPAHNAAPDVSFYGQQGLESDALTINTQQSYQPAQSVYPDSSTEIPFSSQTDVASEGNVLNDLGINEASSTIAQRSYTSGKPSYLDQSPMDILDEYLDEQVPISYDGSNPPIYPPNNFSQEPRAIDSSDYSTPQDLNQRPMQSSFQNPTKQASVSNACKKLFKVFTE